MIGHFRQPRLPKVMGPKSWTTSLVHGEPKDFGRLPHPPGTLGTAEAVEGLQENVLFCVIHSGRDVHDLLK